MRHRPKRSARSLRFQHVAAALIPAAIVILSITGFMWAQREVTVVVDGRTFHISTQARDVASVLDEAGIDYDSGDVITPAEDMTVDSGDTVVVRHAVPVTVDLGGDPVDLDVVGETVADALVAAGADPGSNPSVTPALDEPLKPGMTIEVPDLYTRVRQVETTLTPAVEVQKDASLPKGERKVIEHGTPGKVLRVYRVVVDDGVESNQGLSAEKVISEAEPKVIAVGTGAASGTSVTDPGERIPGPPEGGRRLRVEATGYSPQEPGLDYTTATGARAERGVIAVDPRVIPLGTKVYVPGYGYAVARDTGGAIQGRRIDLCYDTVAEALRWGRRDVTIIICD